MDVGDNIVKLRKAAKMTQAQLAEQVGVARQTVAKWEGGTASPDLRNAKALAEALGVSLDALAGVEPDEDGIPFLPRGKKYYGKCVLGSFGTLRIPEEALELFDLHTGDELVVLGNPTYGIGVCKPEMLADAIAALEAYLLGE